MHQCQSGGSRCQLGTRQLGRRLSIVAGRPRTLSRLVGEQQTSTVAARQRTLNIQGSELERQSCIEAMKDMSANAQYQKPSIGLT